MTQTATEADVLRQVLRERADHDGPCCCGPCAFPLDELTIPPFADHPGDSPSFPKDDD